MFCRECGSKIEDGARFCVNCGAEVRVNNNGEQSLPNTQNGYNYIANLNTSPSKKISKHKLLAAILATVVVFGTVGVVFALKESNNKKNDDVKNDGRSNSVDILSKNTTESSLLTESTDNSLAAAYRFDSFSITVGGQKISLPESAEEIVSKIEKIGGFVQKGSADFPRTLAPNEAKYEGIYFHNGNGVESPRYYLCYMNKTDSEIDEMDAVVGGYSFLIKSRNDYLDEDPDVYLPEVLLPGGITFHSTYDEIIAAYGEPYAELDQHNYTNDYDYKKLYFNITDTIELRLDLDDKGVFAIDYFLIEEYDYEGTTLHGRPDLDSYY